MTDFSELGLSPETLKAVSDTGYTTPTPIQEQAIPVALAGRDVLGIAQTGTGKTAAFTLPMIDRLAAGRAIARMPRALVLAPTRELADQVAASFEKYAKGRRLTWALLIGGVSMEEQLKKLDRGADVLIATPGRLLDLYERGKLPLMKVSIMVVDEADRMLDMGFIPDLERIFKLTPANKQTLFFSATMPPEITRLTTQFLRDPTRIEASRPATTAETITQHVVRIPIGDAKAKRMALRALVERADVKNGIVFCNRKTDVDIVAKSLRTHGQDASPIHGDLDQSVRTKTLDAFRKGELKLLVASDVAARGLDIPAVSHVFNYDVPHHADDYVHRIGRTGRAGLTGETYMLVTPNDGRQYDKVVKLTGKTPDEVVLDLDWSEAEGTDKPARRPSRSGRDGPARETQPAKEEAPARERGERSPRRARSEPREVEPAATPVSETTEEVPRRARTSRATRPSASIPAPEIAPDITEVLPTPEPVDLVRASRSGYGRGGVRAQEPRDENDRSVVGFGAEAPAFLARAVVLPARKAAMATVED